MSICIDLTTDEGQAKLCEMVRKLRGALSEAEPTGVPVEVDKDPVIVSCRDGDEALSFAADSLLLNALLLADDGESVAVRFTRDGKEFIVEVVRESRHIAHGDPTKGAE